MYFIVSTGPLGYAWWFYWAQIALDGVFFLLWIVAAAISNYTCDGLCASCSAGGALLDDGNGFYVWVGSLLCYCVFDGDNDNFKKRAPVVDDLISTVLRIRASSGSNAGPVAEEAVTIATKQGIDGALM